MYKFTDQKEKYIRALHYKLNCVIYKNEPILAWLFEDHSNADTIVIIHGSPHLLFEQRSQMDGAGV